MAAQHHNSGQQPDLCRFQFSQVLELLSTGSRPLAPGVGVQSDCRGGKQDRNYQTLSTTVDKENKDVHFVGLVLKRKLGLIKLLLYHRPKIGIS